MTDLMAMTTGQKETPFTVNESSTDAGTTSEREPSSVGEEFTTFLTLLTAQIENQDPLAPLDSTQFVQQLATFSGLELQAKANNFLEDISIMLAQQLYPNSNPTP